MHHLAIMNPAWNFIPEILTRQKTIESRWYLTRRAPSGKITIGDHIFFKDSGKPVTAMAKVSQVIECANLTPVIAEQILKQYGHDIGFTPKILQEIKPQLLRKKYCMLIFLSNAHSVEPFNINKKGFGQNSAWISVKDIDQIKAK